jgi:hypothetical protein
MEPEGSLPHSQVPATCPYPEPARSNPDRSNPYPHIPLPEDPSYYYPPIYTWVPKWRFPSGSWKRNNCYIFWGWIFSLSYPARKAHAPYYIVKCEQSGSTIFFHIISQTERFSEKITEHKTCVLIFSTTFLRRIQQHIIIDVHRSPCSVSIVKF